MNVRTLVLLVALTQGVAAAENAPDARSDIAKPTIETASSTSNSTIDVTPLDSKSGQPDIANPAIDMSAYLRVSMEAAAYRQSHRVSEEDFLRMSSEPGTIVLDARSAEKYGLLHVKGAINLSFSDITVDSLKQTIPDKSTRVLIILQQQFHRSPEALPHQAAQRFAQPVDLYRAVQLRLQKCLRAGAVDRSEGVEAGVRGDRVGLLSALLARMPTNRSACSP